MGLVSSPGPSWPRRTAASSATPASTAELKAPAEAFAQDIHQQFGLTCKDCHGGNPAQDDADKAKDKTFKGAPKRARIPEFCANAIPTRPTCGRSTPTSASISSANT